MNMGEKVFHAPVNPGILLSDEQENKSSARVSKSSARYTKYYSKESDILRMHRNICCVWYWKFCTSPCLRLTLYGFPTPTFY